MGDISWHTSYAEGVLKMKRPIVSNVSSALNPNRGGVSMASKTAFNEDKVALLIRRHHFPPGARQIGQCGPAGLGCEDRHVDRRSLQRMVVRN